MDRLVLQNFIRSLVTNFGAFAAVSYPEGEATAEATTSALPATVLVNEVQSTFGPDPLMGRREVRKRLAWTFELHLNFNAEVVLDPFVQSLLDEVPRINGYAIKLLNYSVQHPPQQSPDSGTKCRMVIEASAPRA